jgi:hypothetical protein
MAANSDMFVEEPKSLSASLRLQALLQAAANSSRVHEFPDLEPGIRTLLEQNAALFTRIAE